MADLYSRLQELKKHQRSRPTRAGAGVPGRNGGRPQDADVGSGSAARLGAGVVSGDQDMGHSPGPQWHPVAPGVYERSRIYPLTDRALPFDVDSQGRWFGIPRLIGSYAGTRPIFLDVETSGLSGGAGSTAFLIGVGFVSRGSASDVGPTSIVGPTSTERSTSSGGDACDLHEPDVSIAVHQLFLSEPAAEAALLARFAELVGDPATACYVTYNGGSFDLPVLRTRHIMNRLRLPEALHWDLMPLTRRVYASVIGSCSLGRVERLVLGVERDDDVPGSEVPSRYHQFIQTGDPSEIAPVVAHHYYDVAHLAMLSARLHEIIGGGSDRTAGAPFDRIGVAKLLVQRGERSDLSRCATLLDEVIAETEHRRSLVSAAARAGGFAARAGSRPSRAWWESRELRAVVARRLEHWHELRTLRETLWNVRGTPHDAVELAKVLEHRFKDYVGALAVMERIDQQPEAGDRSTAHRVARLRRKIDRERSKNG
ncbi:MAG: ribonuclease H-like domain-containing protein [Alkalispirochaeta sp.]